MLKELVTICEKIIMQVSLGGVDSKLLICDPGPILMPQEGFKV